MTATPEPVRKRLQAPPDAQRFVLGVAYPSGRVDGHGEFCGPDELERIAHEYVRKHRTVGFAHVDGTTSHAELVESFVHRGPDWETTDITGATQVIKQGDWCIGVVFDQPGFEAVLNEAVDGFSMQGIAPRRLSPVPKERP